METTPTNGCAHGQGGRGQNENNAGHCATMPRPATRRAAILAALRQGERLTQADGLRRGWGWRLAADIFSLREYGWPIVSDLVRQGHGQPIARYHLPAGDAT
jgi:hypothetical protein